MFNRIMDILRGSARPFILLMLMAFMVSCSLFEYHPYETNVDHANRDLNLKAIEKIRTNSFNDTLTIVAMGDTQRFYDEVEDFVESVNSVQADFIFLNGDITDFGIKDEYEWIQDILRKLNKPYLAVIGNHDISGNGEEIYTKMYGPLNHSFIVNRFKFILLNTNSREYNYNGTVPDINYLKTELKGDDFDRALVVSHIAPFSYDFDSRMEKEYARALKESGKVSLSLHGHDHSFSEGEPYSDGIRYVITTSMDERMYLKIKLFKNEFRLEKIYY